ncbi:tetraspanin [Coccidioides immitis RS]|uniref:Tetraspanin n=6 Tax=Coccidioides TaxID=5500 RepID=J3K6U8_COCIM|nr:tetraspanin [Coccidioides immitis RS]ABY75968.1 tetraspanin Pls1 family protein [Coccidioides posadasii]EFW18090.1 tetraspanin Pls1 family protein [Coccidioides posadasii str. Silveira]KMM66834.1 tetraspanin [Coccidioides posadasii RMSCC 3488]KMP02887.1 tetraspanin [Coccidioides immitis RMSCC 2394]KMU91775.1 tetraspanin [Coccidioides immitis H538.4]TPX23329.1 phospholipid scramblase 1 [Coccidioides immitis]
MRDKLLLTYLVADVLFLGGGALILTVALTARDKIRSAPTLDNVAERLLLAHCPQLGEIINAGFVFFTFLLSIPAIIQSNDRIWMKIHGWMVVISGFITLIIGLIIWFLTLRTRSTLSDAWGNETPEVQSLLQQRFNCCGYLNSTSPPFQVDKTCPTDLDAAQKPGCVGPFSNFANSFLDVIFTADFGIVAIDALLLLCVAMVLKDRKERARYRLIDSKNGFGTI